MISNNFLMDKKKREEAELAVMQLFDALGPLTNNELRSLRKSFNTHMANAISYEDITKAELFEIQKENAIILRDFIEAKRVEGRSDTTLYNYNNELMKLFLCLNKSFRDITAEDVRDYFTYRQRTAKLNARTLSNMRLYLMSFFKWCVVEELMVKSPMDKIAPIKYEKKVVEVLSDEEQEIIRSACKTEREKAIIELLSSSGMRVSELVRLNRRDVNFDKREVIVYGKGQKERVCFFSGAAKVHLMWYLQERIDTNEALFVTVKEPYHRINKAGVEFILRNIAKSSRVPSIHCNPHKYRRTFATNMIRKGAPNIAVSKMLGHSKLDSIQSYVNADIGSVKSVHERYS